MNALDCQIQTEINTAVDRYPLVFAFVADLIRAQTKAANILSFGCSNGSECMILAEKYFTSPNDRILGVDINANVLKQANADNVHPRIRYEISSNDAVKNSAPYDVIFAMSVLCLWPKTKLIENISALFPFERFQATTLQLDRNLKIGGLLVVYNTNFRFSDLDFYKRYEPVSIVGLAESGFVKKFDCANRSLGEAYVYPHSVFRKLRS